MPLLIYLPYQVQFFALGLILENRMILLSPFVFHSINHELVSRIVIFYHVLRVVFLVSVRGMTSIEKKQLEIILLGIHFVNCSYIDILAFGILPIAKQIHHEIIDCPLHLAV